MKEFFKKNGLYIVFVIGVLVATAAVMVHNIDVQRNKEKLAQEHIRIVTLTDKNCNDCHLGASFVNLFNHPAVKSNDNTVNLMLDKAKIKRW